jgi:hypothetical protein
MSVSGRPEWTTTSEQTVGMLETVEVWVAYVVQVVFLALLHKNLLGSDQQIEGSHRQVIFRCPAVLTRDVRGRIKNVEFVTFDEPLQSMKARPISQCGVIVDYETQ